MLLRKAGEVKGFLKSRGELQSTKVIENLVGIQHTRASTCVHSLCRILHLRLRQFHATLKVRQLHLLGTPQQQ
jgi:hypothetical protein